MLLYEVVCTCPPDVLFSLLPGNSATGYMAQQCARAYQREILKKRDKLESTMKPTQTDQIKINTRVQ
jgi:hypothetical protein